MLQKSVSNPHALHIEWLSVEEAARFIYVSQSTVRNWIKKKYFPVYRYGRLIRIERSDLQRFIDESRMGGWPE